MAWIGGWLKLEKPPSEMTCRQTNPLLYYLMTKDPEFEKRYARAVRSATHEAVVGVLALLVVFATLVTIGIALSK